jgi:hypothetical protein
MAKLSALQNCRSDSAALEAGMAITLHKRSGREGKRFGIEV